MEASQYDPRAQAMEEVHFDWRCIVCCMVALSPFIWNSNTSLGLNLFILIWTIHLKIDLKDFPLVSVGRWGEVDGKEAE